MFFKKWKRELEIINSLRKLYPNIIGLEYDVWQKTNYYKAWWVHCLCRFHLNQRIPRLERFMKENGDKWMWDKYKQDFDIKE